MARLQRFAMSPAAAAASLAMIGETDVGRPVVSDRVLATVLFTDIVGSTERAAELGDSQWRSLLERHDVQVREEVERHRGRFVKSLGDGALAVFDGPSRAISSAIAIRDGVHDLGLEIRAGLHTGECELLPDDDVGGLAVHIGARVSSLAGPGEVLVSKHSPRSHRRLGPNTDRLRRPRPQRRPRAVADLRR
jgi:class 3 adenylate cyclase